MPETPQQSSAELIKQAGEQLSHLVRVELALAQAELREKAGRAAVTGGLFGTAAAVTFWAGGALAAAAVLGLALVLPPWLAALATGAALLAVAGILALVGRSRLRRTGSLVPQRALRGLRADVSTLTHPAATGAAQQERW
ncbi:phage holin family protein [Catellatospora sp. NPDC049609]|uniref:phage holin family protein n=1 Tax=Catellatospora sp. NPDC049609 TaxID=3155505 RepID=UPI00342B91AF